MAIGVEKETMRFYMTKFTELQLASSEYTLLKIVRLVVASEKCQTGDATGHHLPECTQRITSGCGPG